MAENQQQIIPAPEWWEKVTRSEVRIESLEKLQARQDCKLKKIDEKMDSVKNWLVGIMGGLLISLIMLVIDLITKRL